jgi:hypothetical protein
LEQAAGVGVFACDNVGVSVSRGLRNDGVGHVTGCGAAHQGASGVGSLFGQGENFTSAQEPVELGVGGGTAGLGDSGGGDDRNDPGLVVLVRGQHLVGKAGGERANLDRLATAMRELGAQLRVAGMTDGEARQLPVRIDSGTRADLSITTWMTDAGPFDVLAGLEAPDGRLVSYEELVG